MYLKALWIKNSVFVRKLLELMPDLEIWHLIVFQYCSFQLGLYWNALFWSLLLYWCGFVFLYLKALWIKNSVFIRKLLELMPDLEFWTLLYCSIVVFSLIFTGTLSSGSYYCISVVLQFGLLRMPRSIVQRYFQLAF